MTTTHPGPSSLATTSDSAAPPPATAPRPPRSDRPASVSTAPQPEIYPRVDWRTVHLRWLRAIDLVICIATMYTAQVVWFGAEAVAVAGTPPLIAHPPYWMISALVAGVWFMALGGVGARDPRVATRAIATAHRVLTASVVVFGLVAITGFLLRLEIARGYLMIAMPFGVIAILFARWVWRRYLLRARRKGRCIPRAIIVWSSDSVAELADEIERRARAGVEVLGACIAGARSADPQAAAPEADVVPGTDESGARPAAASPRMVRIGDVVPGTSIPILGGIDAATALLDREGGDTLIVTAADELTGQRVRELAWGLDPARHYLVLAPSLHDVIGSRLRVEPIDGMPLIHVELPQFSGGARIIKRVGDLVAAAVGLVVLVLPLLALAIAVRATSPGPALFRQHRIGVDGTPFVIYKFRTMRVDAERAIVELGAGERDAGNAVLFKMTDDPRVTPIGRWMRRYSVDELPQLVNVLLGDMSLVGPRPHLPREVEQYDFNAGRRLRVKPGMTGLWQVSGRSNLSWPESVRLDLHYVENWHFMLDPIIMWRTIRAVISKDGAY